jgi:UDP-glucose 4-epimerase
MRLSIEKVSALGWEPTTESDQAVRSAAEGLYEELRAEHHGD